MSAFVGLAVLSSVLCIPLWLAAAWLVRGRIDSSLHRVTIYGTVVAFVLIDLLAVAATFRLGAGDLLMVLFGIGMGVQVIAALAAFLFGYRR